MKCVGAACLHVVRVGRCRLEDKEWLALVLNTALELNKIISSQSVSHNINQRRSVSQSVITNLWHGAWAH